MAAADAAAVRTNSGDGTLTQATMLRGQRPVATVDQAVPSQAGRAEASGSTSTPRSERSVLTGAQDALCCPRAPEPVQDCRSPLRDMLGNSQNVLSSPLRSQPEAIGPCSGSLDQVGVAIDTSLTSGSNGMVIGLPLPRSPGVQSPMLDGHSAMLHFARRRDPRCGSKAVRAIVQPPKVGIPGTPLPLQGGVALGGGGVQPALARHDGPTITVKEECMGSHGLVEPQLEEEPDSSGGHNLQSTLGCTEGPERVNSAQQVTDIAARGMTTPKTSLPAACLESRSETEAPSGNGLLKTEPGEERCELAINHAMAPALSPAVPSSRPSSKRKIRKGRQAALVKVEPQHVFPTGVPVSNTPAHGAAAGDRQTPASPQGGISANTAQPREQAATAAVRAPQSPVIADAQERGLNPSLNGSTAAYASPTPMPSASILADVCEAHRSGEGTALRMQEGEQDAGPPALGRGRDVPSRLAAASPHAIVTAGRSSNRKRQRMQAEPAADPEMGDAAVQEAEENNSRPGEPAADCPVACVSSFSRRLGEAAPTSPTCQGAKGRPGASDGGLGNMKMAAPSTRQCAVKDVMNPGRGTAGTNGAPACLEKGAAKPRICQDGGTPATKVAKESKTMQAPGRTLPSRSQCPPPGNEMGRLQPLVVVGRNEATEPTIGAVQLSRSGRVRVKPLAYWANQSICIDHKAGRAYAIDPGFPDQLTASAAGITLPLTQPKSGKTGNGITPVKVEPQTSARPSQGAAAYTPSKATSRQTPTRAKAKGLMPTSRLTDSDRPLTHPLPARSSSGRFMGASQTAPAGCQHEDAKLLQSRSPATGTTGAATAQILKSQPPLPLRSPTGRFLSKAQVARRQKGELSTGAILTSPTGKSGVTSEPALRPLPGIEPNLLGRRGGSGDPPKVEDADAGAPVLSMGGQGEEASGYPGDCEVGGEHVAVGARVVPCPTGQTARRGKPPIAPAGLGECEPCVGRGNRTLRSGKVVAVDAAGTKGQMADDGSVPFPEGPPALADGPSKRTRTRGPVPSPGDVEAGSRLMHFSSGLVPSGRPEAARPARTAPADPPAVPHNSRTDRKQGAARKEKALAHPSTTGPGEGPLPPPSAPSKERGLEAHRNTAGNCQPGDAPPGGSGIRAGQSTAAGRERRALRDPEGPRGPSLTVKNPAQQQNPAPVAGAAPNPGKPTAAKSAKRKAPGLAPQAPPVLRLGARASTQPDQPSGAPPKKAKKAGPPKKPPAASANVPGVRQTPTQAPPLRSPGLAEAAIAAGIAAAVAASPQGPLGAPCGADRVAPLRGAMISGVGAGGRPVAQLAAATAEGHKVVGSLKGKAARPAKPSKGDCVLGGGAVNPESGEGEGKGKARKGGKEPTNRVAIPTARATQLDSVGKGRSAGVARRDAGQSSDEDVGSGEEEGAWTGEQVAALQAAYLTVDPQTKGFWSHVAAHVPGKSATECFDRHFNQYPTPPAASKPPKPRRYGTGVGPAAQLPTKTNGGGVRKPTALAVRKEARLMAWQERAEAAHATVQGREGAGPNVAFLEAAARQEQNDKVIDAFLANHGPPSRWAARTAVAAQKAVQQRKGTSLLRPANLAQAVNLLRQEGVLNGAAPEEDTDTDVDEYFSDEA